MKKNNSAIKIVVFLISAVLLFCAVSIGVTYVMAACDNNIVVNFEEDDIILTEQIIVDEVLEIDNQNAKVENVTENDEIEETVTLPTPMFIELVTDGTKTEYVIGETINYDGLVVNVGYDNGNVESVPIDECAFGDVDMSTIGTKSVEIYYDIFTATYNIEVNYNVVSVDEHVMYTTSNLNLRVGPGTDYEKVTTVSVNTPVTVIGEVVDSSWVKVVYKDGTYYCSGNYLSKSKQVVSYESSGSDANIDKYAYGSFITGEVGTSDKVVYEANKYWVNNVPQWLREKYENSGWKIIVSAQPLNRRFGYSGSIAAITLPSECIIYLDNRTSVMERAMIHELGHFIDVSNGWVSYSDEFVEIFESEKRNYTNPTDVGDGHHKSNATEYFAEVFRDMIVRGRNVGDIPATYEFVSRYIG